MDVVVVEEAERQTEVYRGSGGAVDDDDVRFRFNFPFFSTFNFG